MIEWVLSFVPWWAWLTGGVVLAGAAWPYLGLRGAVAIVFVATTWTAYLGGVAHERGRGEVARLEAELATAKADIAVAKRAETDAAMRSAVLDAASRSNQDIINELEARLAAQAAEQQPVEPVPPPQSGAVSVTPRAPTRACSCVVTGDYDRFLRRIQ